MKTVEIELTKHVTYKTKIQVSDEEFEIIKDLEYEDVEPYDFTKVKQLGGGKASVPANEAYNILEFIDDVDNEVDRDETMFNVTVTELCS